MQATLAADVRTTLVRHGCCLKVEERTSRGVNEFWKTLTGLGLHAKSGRSADMHRCLMDGCSTVFTATRGAETLYFPACYLVDAIDTALTPRHGAWVPFQDVCTDSDDVPAALFDLLLMHPPPLLAAVFPQMRTNVWRRVTGNPAASSTLCVPEAIAAMVNVFARAFPCYSVMADSLSAAFEQTVERLGKRARVEFDDEEGPRDTVAAALLYMVAPMLLSDEVAGRIMPVEHGRFSIAQSAVYMEVWRACSVAEITSKACAEIFSRDCDDLFYALRDALQVFETAPPAHSPAARAPAVCKCHILPADVSLLPETMRLAESCAPRVASALLEGMRRSSGAETLLASFSRTRRVVVIHDAAYADALLFCRSAWDGQRNPETQCITTDTGVACIIPEPEATSMSSGAMLHALVGAARHPQFEGVRYPIYGALARLYFGTLGAGWAVATLALLAGMQVPNAKIAVAPKTLHETLPDFVDALIGEEPLFLLASAEGVYRDMRRVLPPFLHAAATGTAVSLDAVAKPVARLLRALGIEPFSLTNPGALIHFAGACLQGLQAGCIERDDVLRLLVMIFPEREAPAPRPPRRWTGALEAQCVPLETMTTDDGGDITLDEHGRRRAAAMLKLFAVYDTADAGLDEAEADAHLDQMCTALNLELRRDGCSHLAYHHLVYMSANGLTGLRDNQIAVLRPAPVPAVATFGTAAANAVTAAPIRDCAAVVLEHVGDKGASRFAISREVDQLYKQWVAVKPRK
jgi:hypothetical protein